MTKSTLAIEQQSTAKTKSGNNGYYKRRRGLLEHIEAGTIDLLEDGIHDYLSLKANLLIGSSCSIPAGVCFTSAPAIHVHCRRVSERTIQRCLEHMEAIGWLKTWKTPGKRGNYPTLLCRGSVHDLSGKEFRVSGEKTTDWRHPVYEPVGEVSGECRHSVVKLSGYREVRTESQEKDTNPLTSLERGCEVFEQFWSLYPRKISKQRTAKVWKKIKPTEIPAILASVETWKKTDQWHRDGGRFIPYPTTFLNDRRWEDDVPEPQVLHTEGKGKFDDIPVY